MIGPVLLAAAASQALSTCSLPYRWTQIDARKPTFVIFGETHGTRESPELVGSIACALSKREQILVAVELAASTDPELQALWIAPAVGFRKRLMKQLPYFADRTDGVGSEAMLVMLDELHRLARAGQTVDIVAFSGARGAAQAQRWSKLSWQAAHEAEQAENIAQAARKKDYAHVLVLVGNAHAQKQRLESPEGWYEPMALRLAKVGRIVSLVETYASGTMWNCISRVCGMRTTSGSPRRPATQIGLWLTRQNGWNRGFDGYYWFPVVHGSPPARAMIAD